MSCLVGASWQQVDGHGELRRNLPGNREAVGKGRCIRMEMQRKRKDGRRKTEPHRVTACSSGLVCVSGTLARRYGCFNGISAAGSLFVRARLASGEVRMCSRRTGGGSGDLGHFCDGVRVFGQWATSRWWDCRSQHGDGPECDIRWCTGVSPNSSGIYPAEQCRTQC